MADRATVIGKVQLTLLSCKWLHLNSFKLHFSLHVVARKFNKLEVLWWQGWWQKTPKQAKELKALQVKKLSASGRHAVGGVTKLYLNITDTGVKSWILRATVGLNRRHIGLGSYPELSLADARDQALEMKRKIREGIDPVEERKEQRAAIAVKEKQLITFEEAFQRYFTEKIEGELKNAEH